mgnify:CR=1 FL=1
MRALQPTLTPPLHTHLHQHEPVAVAHGRVVQVLHQRQRQLHRLDALLQQAVHVVRPHLQGSKLPTCARQPEQRCRRSCRHKALLLPSLSPTPRPCRSPGTHRLGQALEVLGELLARLHELLHVDAAPQHAAPGGKGVQHGADHVPQSLQVTQLLLQQRAPAGRWRDQGRPSGISGRRVQVCRRASLYPHQAQCCCLTQPLRGPAAPHASLLGPSVPCSAAGRRTPTRRAQTGPAGGAAPLPPPAAPSPRGGSARCHGGSRPAAGRRW